MASFGRTFARQLSLTVGTQVTVGLVGLVRIPLAIDMIGVSGYALLASYSAAAAWLTVPANANRQYVLAFGGWPPLRLAQRMRGGTALLAAAAMSVGVIGFILGNRGNEFVTAQGVGTVAMTFGVLSLIIALLTPGGARLGRFGAWYGVWLFPVLEILGNVCGLAAIWALSRSGSPSISAIAFAWILPIALQYAVGLLLSTRLMHRLFGQRQATDVPADGQQQRALYPYLWIVASPLIAGGLDLFIVGALLTSADVATLALVTRLSAPLLIVPTVIRVLVVREVGRRYSSGEAVAGLGRMRRVIAIATLLQGVAAVGFVALGPVVFDFLADGEITPPFLLFPVIALLFIAATANSIAIGLGSSPEFVRETARITTVASFATVVMSILFVPVLGLVATRLSDLTSVSIQALLIGRLVRRPR